MFYHSPHYFGRLLVLQDSMAKEPVGRIERWPTNLCTDNWV